MGLEHLDERIRRRADAIPAHTRGRHMPTVPVGLVTALALLVGTAAWADDAAKRFPQPVRAGTLIGQPVLQPLESKDVLGTVRQLVRSADGGILVVIAYGGWFGFGARPIAVPVEAVALLGREIEVPDLTPAQLSDLPTYTGQGATPIGPDETIRVGLARPSH